MVSGAFRFTTQALSRFHGERDVKVRIVTITAGIRGTDLWGKADKTRDIVCLIEGKITVSASDAFTEWTSRCRFLHRALKRAGAAGRAGVAETARRMVAGDRDRTGAGDPGRGRWRVYLAEANNQGDALGIHEQLRSGLRRWNPAGHERIGHDLSRANF